MTDGFRIARPLQRLHRAGAFLIPCIVAGCLTGPETNSSEGCPGVAYPDWSDSPYVLPVPVGQSVDIDLSHCSGSFHSQGQPDAYAIDFNMAVGTTITAARPGRVVFVEESGADGGFPNNRVVVDQHDGSYAQYMHLTQSGAAVAVGDSVSSGTVIGLSGATGLAGYPHLHFVVTIGDHAYPYESVPVTFRNTSPNPRSLLSGRRYTATAH